MIAPAHMKMTPEKMPFDKRRFYWVWCGSCDTVMKSVPWRWFLKPVHRRGGERCPGSRKQGEAHE
jgi:hypothetical protein